MINALRNNGSSYANRYFSLWALIARINTLEDFQIKLAENGDQLESNICATVSSEGFRLADHFREDAFCRQYLIGTNDRSRCK